MRNDRGLRTEGTRSSALWGRGSRSERRSSALWGRRGGRSAVVLSALVAALLIPVAGIAGNGNGTGYANIGTTRAVVPASLLAAATASPNLYFNVIVQGSKGTSSGDVENDVKNSNNGEVKRTFKSLSATSVRLKGSQLVQLSRLPGIAAITPDEPVREAGYENAEMWRDTTDMTPLWNAIDPSTWLPIGLAPPAPAIAIVDSGVDASKVNDFGGRLVANVNLSSLAPTATGDDEGHGTMVAGIAAGSNPLHPGAVQHAPIVSIRTADANGRSVTSDVIAAVDWIIANKAKYNIRVANFSMASASNTSFRIDPLDKAVERLWFNGIVVVAAAGNFGEGPAAVDMSKAPGNDPFVITVGATDQHQTDDPFDDTIPAWSAFGFTMDGFSKPDMVAPGRYMISAVPTGASIPAAVPDRVVAPGYMWMSGTSFAAPVVAGAAAQILARHPKWTPDEVKGALMVTSVYLGSLGQAAGVGEIDATAAATLDSAPNPNENFYKFVETDPVTGQRTFNQASWSSAVSAAASWSSANWASASWASASWASASWASASWSSANWTSLGTASLGSATNWSESTFSP